MATWTSTFDGDENPLSESGAWTSGPSGWDACKKLSGVAMAVNTSSDSAARYEGNSLDSDQSSEVTTVNFSSGGSSLGGAITRMQGTTSGTTDCYVVDADFWQDVIRIFRVDDTAGSLAWTQLLGDVSLASTSGGDAWKLSSIGSTHTGYQNGNSRISRTDSDYTGGQPGIFFYVTTLTHVDYTSWEGKDEVPVTEGFVGSTMVAGTAGVTATIHADALTDDILVLTIEGEGEDANADSPPTGGDWTAIDGSTGSVASAESGQADRTRNSTYYHVYDSGSPPNLSVPDAGQHTIAVISVWRGVDTASPLDATSVSSSNSTNSTAGSATGTSTSTAGSRVITICTHGDEGSISSPVNASLTGLAIDGQHSSAAGSDGMVGIISGILAGTGATGTTTWTISVSEEQANWCFAFKLASGDGDLSTGTIYDSVDVSEDLTVSLSELFVDIFDSIDASENIDLFVNPLSVDIYEQVEANESLSEFFDKLSKSVSDLVAVSEQVTVLFPTLKIDIAELVDVSENLSVYLDSLHVDVNDQVSVSEVLSLFLDKLTVAGPYDSVEVSEAITITLDALFKSLAENIGVSENLALELITLGGISPSLDDTVGVSEFLSLYLSALHPNITEQIGVSEFVQLVLTILYLGPSENIDVSEYVNVYLDSLNLEVSESIAVAENIQVALEGITTLEIDFSDSMTVADVITAIRLGITKLLSDSIVVSEGLTVSLATLNKSISEAIGVSESVTAALAISVFPITRIAKRRNAFLETFYRRLLR